jgi:hypothetical protein
MPIKKSSIIYFTPNTVISFNSIEYTIKHVYMNLNNNSEPVVSYACFNKNWGDKYKTLCPCVMLEHDDKMEEIK